MAVSDVATFCQLDIGNTDGATGSIPSVALLSKVVKTCWDPEVAERWFRTSKVSLPFALLISLTGS